MDWLKVPPHPHPEHATERGRPGGRCVLGTGRARWGRFETTRRFHLRAAPARGASELAGLTFKKGSATRLSDAPPTRSKPRAQKEAAQPDDRDRRGRRATPSSPSWDVQVFVSHDGTKLYFDSNRPSGDNDYNIYTTDSSGTQSAALLGDVNLTAYSDGAPVVSDDGNTLYFASDRPGGQGAKDIFVATWNSTAKKFQNPIVVQELNSTGFDKPTWLSPDGCVIYLSSTRTGGLGQSDLYMATRPK